MDFKLTSNTNLKLQSEIHSIHKCWLLLFRVAWQAVKHTLLGTGLRTYTVGVIIHLFSKLLHLLCQHSPSMSRRTTLSYKHTLQWCGMQWRTLAATLFLSVNTRLWSKEPTAWIMTSQLVAMAQMLKSSPVDLARCKWLQFCKLHST